MCSLSAAELRWLLLRRLIVCDRIVDRLLNVAPLIDSVQILEVLIEGSTTIHFVIWDLLHQYFLRIGLRWMRPLCHHLLPAKVLSLEESMIFDLEAIVGSRAQSLGWISIKKGDKQGA